MAEAMPSVAPEPAARRKPDTRLFGADTIVVDGVEHSRRDFEKVAASTPHQDCVHEVRHALRREFDSRPGDAFVADDLNVYYDERDQRRAVVAPDIMVAVGVAQRDRNRYRVWEEGRPPSFVLEVLSSNTWRADLGSKKAAYARMGAREYFVFDGGGRLMDPPRLQGFRLGAGDIPGYRPIPPWGAAESTRRRAEIGYWCETLALGIALLPGEPGVRFYDPATGRYLTTTKEDHVGHARQRARADQEQARADREQALRLQEQALRLQEQALRLQERTRADQEQELRLQAQARADKAEAQRREALARVAELERTLTKHQSRASPHPAPRRP